MLGMRVAFHVAVERALILLTIAMLTGAWAGLGQGFATEIVGSSNQQSEYVRRSHSIGVGSHSLAAGAGSISRQLSRIGGMLAHAAGKNGAASASMELAQRVFRDRGLPDLRRILDEANTTDRQTVVALQSFYAHAEEMDALGYIPDDLRSRLKGVVRPEKSSSRSRSYASRKADAPPPRSYSTPRPDARRRDFIADFWEFMSENPSTWSPSEAFERAKNNVQRANQRIRFNTGDPRRWVEVVDTTTYSDTVFMVMPGLPRVRVYLPKYVPRPVTVARTALNDAEMAVVEKLVALQRERLSGTYVDGKERRLFEAGADVVVGSPRDLAKVHFRRHFGVERDAFDSDLGYAQVQRIIIGR